MVNHDNRGANVKLIATTQSSAMRIVDVHAHVGMCKTLPWLGCRDLDNVLDRSRRAGIDYSIVSHLDALYYPKQRGRAANTALLRAVEKRDDAFMWWVYDPRDSANARRVREMAGHPKIVGLKIGPTYHRYLFNQYGQQILELAEELGLAVLTHSGEERDMPGAIVRLVNRYPEVRFVIAHYGNCDQFRGHLRAMRACRSRRCFVDTSSAVSMYSDHIEAGVRVLGSGRFLFGTDTPLYCAAAQLARIQYSDLSDAEKRAIVGANAMKHLLSV